MRNFVDNKIVMSQLELSVHSRLHSHAGVPWPEAFIDAKPCFKNPRNEWMVAFSTYTFVSFQDSHGPVRRVVYLVGAY